MIEHGKVTIKTIAKKAGVSHTTVSRALNDSPLVNEKTKKKIHQLAVEMNYSPNLNAKALVEKKSFLVVVYFTDLSEGTSPAFMAEVIHQVKDALPRGYEVAVDSLADLRTTHQNINLQFDGALVFSQSTSDDEYIDQLASTGKPVVVLNRKVDRSDLHNYSCNDYAGAALAVKYLLRFGHKKIAFISGREDFASAKLRKQGFEDTIKQAHLQTRSQWIANGDYSIQSGYRAMEQILSAEELPSCVFAANDDMAMGAIRACEDYGFSVPDQISFIGFDDNSYSKYYTPRITTVRKPTRQIAQCGVAVLKELMKDEQPSEPQFRAYTPTLVVRDSVRKI